MAMHRCRTAFGKVFRAHNFCIPHPEKVHKGGEDASFVLSRAIAVADGVGGWQRVGVDPAEYSSKLIGNLSQECGTALSGNSQGNSNSAQQQAAVNGDTGASGGTNSMAGGPQGGTGSSSNSLNPADDEMNFPVRLMRRAYDGAMHVTGSSTCCLATLGTSQNGATSDTTCHIANLGDSGALVFRPRTKEILKPETSDLHSFEVEEGDLVFLATDGVFDNVFDEEIIESAATTASSFLKYRTSISNQSSSFISDEKLSVEERAVRIAKAAYAHSLDATFASPFSLKEREYFKQRHPVRYYSRRFGARFAEKRIIGGKSDDITVILASVHSE